MVDALHAAHRAVKQGGYIVDARPDGSRHPRILAGGRVRAYLLQCPDTDDRDARSDRAVAQLIREGDLMPIRSGRVWHRSRFADLRELDGYVSDSGRYCEYERGTRRALLPFRKGPILMRRAIRFAVLKVL